MLNYLLLGNTSEPALGEESGSESEQESNTNPSCTCQCCQLQSYRPEDEETLTRTIKEYGHGKQLKTRYFRKEWYKSFEWLTLCSTTYKAFCTDCMKAKRNGLLTFSAKMEQAFISTGFCNWKKAMGRFKEHESSACHKEAIAKLAILSSKEPDIAAKLTTQRQNEQKKNRELLLTLLSSVCFLARQGLALRGNVEQEGNLYQLLKLRISEQPNVKEWLQDGTYMSHDIINEIVKLMGNTLLRKLIEEVKVAGFYAVLADETRDRSNKEQLVICLRWVDGDFNVYEEPIGLFQVPETTAATLFAVIKDVLLRCSLPIELCRGQGYDGASNMFGKVTGVAKRFKEEQQAALRVHCLGHCVNLVLQDTCRDIKAIRDALDLAREISRLIKFSPKHEVMFTKNQMDASGHLVSGEESTVARGIKPLCPTRWTVRTGAIDAILKNYSILQETMIEINKHQRDDNGIAAGGIASLMDNFQTLWGLKLSHVIFSAAEQLSVSLQGKDTSVQEAQKACKGARNYYKRLRSEDEFTAVYDDAVRQAALLNIEPTLPRYRKRPRRLDNGQEPHRFQSPKDLHRQEFFEALELVDNQLERRFEQEDFQVVCDLENMLLKAANGTLSSIPETITKTYSADINKSRLECQLKMFADVIAASTDNIKEVTSIRTICDVLNTSQVTKKLFSEVARLTQIYLTIPVTTATAERSFSALRRVKTWLRSTMTQERLNNLLLLYAHKHRTDELSLIQIGQDFAGVNERRKSFFGKF